MRAARAIAMLCVLAIAGTGTATAVRPQTNAEAASHVYQVKECFDSYAWGRIPLRIGNKSFGYTHIKLRRGYNARMRRLIRRTLLSYTTYEPQGDTIVFRRYRSDIVETVVVGFNPIPHARDKDQIIGIITAYKAKRQGKRRGYPPPNGGDSTDSSVCSG